MQDKNMLKELICLNGGESNIAYTESNMWFSENLKYADFVAELRENIQNIFHFWPHLQRIDGRFRLYAGIFFKPLYADEIRWELSEQMAHARPGENFSYAHLAKNPTSYRIIGLEIGPAKILHDEWTEVDCSNTEELQFAMEKLIEEQLQIIEGITEEDYKTETPLSMINIFSAIRNNDFWTAWRTIIYTRRHSSSMY